MKISTEFSKHALDYGSHNIIQNKVINKLLLHVASKPQNILDLGCGSGSLCQKVDWNYQHFTGVDFAPGMLELHPKAPNIECIYGNFNDDMLFENLLTYRYDYIFSASSLQWSDDLEHVFSKIKELNAPIALAIFTANTFKTLNATANIKSILKIADEVNELQKKYFNANFEVVNYKLKFDNTREMFKYIKKSGVSGSRKVLDYKQTTKLLREYPLSYLEFEVVFVYT